MKNRNDNKEEVILVDLSGRKDIKIVSITKPKKSTKNAQKFEERLQKRYQNSSEFIDFCIPKNKASCNSDTLEEEFKKAMESMLE